MKKPQISSLRSGALRVAQFHFVYVSLFAIQTIVFHASKLIVPEVILQRWYATAGLLVITTVVWYLAKNRLTSTSSFKLAVGALILADIAFAAFNVYTQRGYASKAVILFVIPIFVAAILSSRSALIATALLCIAAYATTAISYFFLNFNEGYMSELYGEIGFYSALFLLLAGLLWAIVRRRQN